ncbi:MAG: response regulator [Lachnospiraceae bacterium]|nr:response regulator [Lachnospiraceae bacterium]
MVKVMIADDEERICQLINALVDWEALGMEVIGCASNGIEAVERVHALHPDILITDIRMPGCDGLELIQRVKESQPELEVVIISGYAHFSYAQTAIKYGVGDYLLKPINKIELTQTLQKLQEKISERNESEYDRQVLIKNSENDRKRVKENLITDLLENDDMCVSFEMLQEEYHLDVEPGIFQAFCLKMDYDAEQLSAPAKKVLFEKAGNMIESSLKGTCFELVLSMKDYVIYGILNYAPKRQEDIRRLLRDCLNQLTVQKSILGPIDFSIGMGDAVKQPEELVKSMKKSTCIVKERILVGTGHLLENMEDTAGIQGKNLLEKYSRMILHASEVMSEEEADASAEYLKTTALNLRNIRGFELLELVLSAGSLLMMQVEHGEKNHLLEEFKKKCEQSNSVNMLFEQLQDLQYRVIRTLQEEHDTDALRPIRLAKQYIQNHFKEQITLEEVSDAVGLSAGYFSVLFKKETGEGFAKYLINIRVEQAKILLRESNVSVADICKSVGYNDLKHFTHTFDKATGLKPGAYRKLYG